MEVFERSKAQNNCKQRKNNNNSNNKNKPRNCTENASSRRGHSQPGPCGPDVNLFPTPPMSCSPWIIHSRKAIFCLLWLMNMHEYACIGMHTKHTHTHMRAWCDKPCRNGSEAKRDFFFYLQQSLRCLFGFLFFSHYISCVSAAAAAAVVAAAAAAATSAIAAVALVMVCHGVGVAVAAVAGAVGFLIGRSVGWRRRRRRCRNRDWNDGETVSWLQRPFLLAQHRQSLQNPGL